MIIHKEGDKSKAICGSCGKIVPTTFKYADYIYGGSTIKSVLQGFCDVCGTVASLPHQSSRKIKEFNEGRRESFELRVPPHFEDVLLAIGDAHNISLRRDSIFRIVHEFYIRRLRDDYDAYSRKILSALDDDLSKGRSSGRLSCRLPSGDVRIGRELSTKIGRKVSDVAKGIIITAKRELLDDTKSRVGREFEKFAARAR